MHTFSTQDPWQAEMPHTLVVSCSDGRIQAEVDQFLREHLGIVHYDRVYVPGGAGALSSSGCEFTRAHDIRAECRFLITVHGVKHVILIFHGPAADGPIEAVCGDYLRKMPSSSAQEIRAQQEEDAEEVMCSGFGPGVTLSCYWCEVTGGCVTRFVPLTPRARRNFGDAIVP